MNRIKMSPLASTPVSKSKEFETDHSSIATAIENLHPHIPGPVLPDVSVYVPMHYEKGYSYPLIVWLHSDGDDCGQLQRVMPDVSLRNYVGIAPESPHGNRNRGYFWPQDHETVDRAYSGVLAAIDHASCRFSLNSSRIFLAGYGNGGTMAFRVAFQRPELFAGVISLNGRLPDGNRPLAQLSACRDLPVFWAHCRKSVEFGQSELCTQLKLLHVAGFSVTVRQYPCGDQLSPGILGDVNRWIMDSIDTSV